MQTRIHLKPVFVALAMALGGMLAPNPAANPVALAATSYVVNDTVGDCGSYSATYVSIQTAVDDAIANNVKTILVCPGTTYDSFVVDGASKLTIKAALAGTFPKVNAPAGSTLGDIILVQESSGVVLDGLKIDGTDFSDSLGFTTYGIRFLNASGTVQNSTVTRVRCFPNSCDLGTAISLENTYTDGRVFTLTVKNSNITDFDSDGILAKGPSKITVSAVRLSGNFSGGTGTFGYGVRFRDGGVSGSVTKSTISNVESGIQLFGASKVTVSGNTIDHVENGVLLETTCSTDYKTASSNKVTGNTLSDIGLYGVDIHSGGSGCTLTDKNTVSGNRIFGASGSLAGVLLDVAANASANKNKISGNTIFGFSLDIFNDPDATNTSISKNNLIP